MNLLNFETRNETNEFLNTMNSHFMLPFVLQPTRITEHSATLIDYIFANVFCHNALSGNIVTKIADHLPQFLIAEDINLSYKSTEFYIHDFAQFNADNFFDDFSSLDWSFLEASNLDTNARFDRFLVHTSNCVNTHAPHRKLSKREVKLKAKPWLTKRILKKIKYRDKLFSRVLNQPNNSEVLYLFKKFRNQIVSDILKREQEELL